MCQILLALSACLVMHVAYAADETLQERANGPSVVEVACSKIQSVCIFPDDKLMLRRIANVETNDGQDAGTYVPGYYGGIWKVDEALFLATKQMNQSIFTAIKAKFNIDWLQVNWTDLLKPFYSGLAARLYLYSLAKDLPRPVSDQATFWATKYRKTGQASDYTQKVANLKTTCNEVADVVFVVDASGSIGTTNFELVKSFLKNVTKLLNIGPNPVTNTRVSVVQFSDISRLEFDLKNYSTAADYESAINRISYMNAGTQTDAALNYLADKSFLPSAGGRAGVPKIGIVMTDGASNDQALTHIAAAKVHSAGIIVFGIGVGTGVNQMELSDIASDPDCQHLFNLSNFAEFESLVEAIRKETCSAPVIVTPNTTYVAQVANNNTKNCQLTIGPNGTTVEITGKGQGSIYFSNGTFPTSSFYELKYDITYRTPAVVDFPGTGANRTVYCYLENSQCRNVTVSMNQISNSVNPCLDNPCACGEICIRKPSNSFDCVMNSSYSGSTSRPDTSTTTISPITNGGSGCGGCGSGGSGCGGCGGCGGGRGGFFDCVNRNPCTPYNAGRKRFYFPCQESNKFVQCGWNGQCNIIPCPYGYVWSQQLNTCVPS